MPQQATVGDMNVTNIEDTAEDSAKVAKVKSELDALRKDLIDIGARNNQLVNFKPSRRLGADLYAADIDTLYEALAEQGKRRPIRGRSKEQALRQAGDNDHHDFGELKDNVLYADLTPDQLRTRLTMVNSETKRHQLEMGFEYLYLALGFLTYEFEEGKQSKTAPLILIPVDLVSSPVQNLFSVGHNGLEIGPNIALDLRLRNDFDIELPKRTVDSEPSVVLDEVEDAIKTKEGWKVDRSRVHLGFFSNASFMMYQDLDPENWNHAPLHEHPVLSRILGSRTLDREQAADPPAKGPNAGGWPRQLTPVVLDADSSQIDAINAAGTGKNIVIQGPPGTGKSQTITNIIARYVTQGKRVLFVAAKLAALEVVKRRLNEVQLGDAALELHSHKAAPKTVLAELERTLNLGEPVSTTSTWEKRSLIDSERALSDHSEAVNREISKSKRNYVQVCSELERLSADNERLNSDFSIAGLVNLSEDALEYGLARLRDLADQRKVIGDPNSGPFRNFHLVTIKQGQYDEAIAHYRRAKALLEEIANDAREIAHAICVTEPEDFDQLDSMIRFASSELNEAPPNDISKNGHLNVNKFEELRTLVRTVDSIRTIRHRRNTEVADFAWDESLGHHRAIWESRGRSLLRMLNGEYRATRSRLHSIFNRGVVRDFNECIEAIDDVIEFQRLRSKFRELAPATESALGPLWHGGDSDWSEVQEAVSWINTRASQLESKVRRFKAHIEAAKTLLGTDLYSDHGGSFADDSIYQANETLQQVATVDFVNLLQRARYNELRETARACTLRSCVDMIHAGVCDYEVLEHEVRRRWLEALRHYARVNFPAITHFNVKNFEKTRSVFVERDEDSLKWARAESMNQHFSRLPDPNSFGAQLDVLKIEIRKKKRHMPIRELFEKTLGAIQALKPAMMMSPPSVAKFLPRCQTQFDVVIFDEASQLRASEAIGAIVRATQVIVVGDDKQLPPSNFFKLVVDDDLPDEDDPADVIGIESILDLVEPKADLSTTLRWHYRSRSENLIDYSNRHFYDHNLVTFPGSGSEALATGLSLRFDKTNLYTPGAAINGGEARAVAQRVLLHARESGSLSLGVVAFSVRQRNLILDELELAKKQHPELEDFFSENGREPFFVKNLENVQGDERDVILISVGYGLQEDGKLAQNFGPINREGGQRRLNVLITRAKLSMEVFCNFKADALKTKHASPDGLKALKGFLEYAEDPNKVLATETGLGAESLFEEQVAEVVTSLGYEVETQVGMSGYRIDIGVRSVKEPGRYALGIECDGASYHSSFSARDRDRLRQNHLESMGWRIHRIWSTDWFESTTEDRKRRLRQVIEAAQAASAEDT